LAAGLTSLAARLDPAEAAKAARVLAEALEHATDHNARNFLAAELTSLAARLDAAAAAKVCGPAAKVLAESLEHETDANARHYLAAGLTSLATRLDAADAAKMCGPAAKVLAEALEHATDANARVNLAAGLTSLAARLDAAEAARVCGPAAKVLADALEHAPDAGARNALAKVLTSLAARLDAAEAAKVCRKSLRIFLAARESTFRQDEALSEYDSMDGLLTYVESGIGHVMARGLIGAYCAWKGQHFSPFEHTPTFLISIICDRSPTRQHERATRSAVAMALMPGSGGVLAAAAIAAEPYPCRLTTQELVELLKMPTCYGQYSRVVLDQLGNIHGRRFASRGEFIRFARETGLDLDLTTPPTRPDPREPLERLLDPPAAVVKP